MKKAKKVEISFYKAWRKLQGNEINRITVWPSFFISICHGKSLYLSLEWLIFRAQVAFRSKADRKKINDFMEAISKEPLL